MHLLCLISYFPILSSAYPNRFFSASIPDVYKRQADECFQHGIGRTVDDLVQAMQDVLDLETVKTKIEGLQENATGGDADILKKQMEAVEKALTLSKDKRCV